MNDFEKIRTLMQDEDVKEFVEPLFLYLKATMNINPALKEQGKFGDFPTMFLPWGFSNIHENLAIAYTDLRSIGRCFNEYLETADAGVVYAASSFSKPKTLSEEYFKVKNPVFKNFLEAMGTPPRFVNIAAEVPVIDAIGYSIMLALLESKKATIKLSDGLNDLLRQIKNPPWARFIDPICRDTKVFDSTFKLPGLYLLREYVYNTTGGHPYNTFLVIESSKEVLPSMTELLSVIEKAFSDFRDLETLTIEEKSLATLVPYLEKSEKTATYLKDLPEQDYLNKLVSEGLLKVYPDRRVTPAKNINSYKFTEMLNEVQQKQRKVVQEWLNSLVKWKPGSKITKIVPQILPPKPEIGTKEIDEVLVGFECGTGKAVSIKPAHLFISGVTQKAGKTTTLEALIHRSGLRAISFITKPGEKCFDTGHPHKPYFHGKAEWRSIEKLFESLLEEKIKDVRHKLIELCKKEKTLTAIKENIDRALENATKDSEKRPLILLQAYFDDLFKGLEGKEHVEQLDLKEGVNLMDLTDYTEELQNYIINSVLNEILNTHENIIVLVPEAWKFIPQSKRSPCKYPIEQLIRQGAAKNNFVWFDSQDIANVDKAILKSVSVWLLGLQTEINEVKHTIEQIPLPKEQKPTEDQIMSLGKGEFFECSDGDATKTYVMPSWMEEDEAKKIAISKLPFRQNP